MGDIVNLRLVRKAKVRAAKEATAAANRALHGRPKAERRALETERTRAEQALDGARLQSNGGDATRGDR